MDLVQILEKIVKKFGKGPPNIYTAVLCTKQDYHLEAVRAQEGQRRQQGGLLNGAWEREAGMKLRLLGD